MMTKQMMPIFNRKFCVKPLELCGKYLSLTLIGNQSTEFCKKKDPKSVQSNVNL